jgi:hypothetical protein
MRLPTFELFASPFSITEGAIKVSSEQLAESSAAKFAPKSLRHLVDGQVT